MLEKSFEEKLKEREAAIRQQWAAQSKAKKIADADDSSDGLIEGKRAMRVRGDSKRTTTSCGLATSARLVIWPYLVDVTRQVSPGFAAKMAGGKRR